MLLTPFLGFGKYWEMQFEKMNDLFASFCSTKCVLAFFLAIWSSFKWKYHVEVPFSLNIDLSAATIYVLSRSFAGRNS